MELNDEQNPSRARSRVFDTGVDFFMTGSEPIKLQSTITYTNPCDKVDFFDESIKDTITWLGNVPGFCIEQEFLLANFFPDLVSNDLGSTDGYSFCHAVRHYSIE